jgi:hypothetical protein
MTPASGSGAAARRRASSLGRMMRSRRRSPGSTLTFQVVSDPPGEWPPAVYAVHPGRRESMAIAPGTRQGPYEVTAAIGAGGMGMFTPPAIHG